ncbi:hypothetical protein MBT84_37335 [Streptomyces sp. MBT84]|uniref:hypothetical protein n=1 Tax=unclassified Streptomyces TaxID=2593676 RepID=UPI001C6E649C|nr:hypothetical protein [Streptomyces sp. MBT84]MBW8705279.1 hypothetical protein [Streptomyces sp. MBT84]
MPRRAGRSLYSKRNQAEAADLVSLIFNLRVEGLSYRAIEALTADPDGPTGGKRIAFSSVRDIAEKEYARRIDPKVDHYRALELARLEASLERLANMEETVREVMGCKHITVNNGRVIRLLNPDTGEEEPLEDDGVILQAVDRLNRIEEARRRSVISPSGTVMVDAPPWNDLTQPCLLHLVRGRLLEVLPTVRIARH